MNFGLQADLIPGTVLRQADMGNVTGLKFLNKIFFITEGIMLGQIREITGMDGSTLQNWVKRGWLGTTTNKRYNKKQLARILLINMLRKNMQLEQIVYLLRYVNGDLSSTLDDTIDEALLYDYVCRILDQVATGATDADTLRATIGACTADYEEPIGGARRRLNAVLEIMVVSYFTTLLQGHTAELLSALQNPKKV